MRKSFKSTHKNSNGEPFKNDIIVLLLVLDGPAKAWLIKLGAHGIKIYFDINSQLLRYFW